MDPSKKRRRPLPEIAPVSGEARAGKASTSSRKTFGDETEEDREKDLADAESKNLWDATEVIDMDKV